MADANAPEDAQKLRDDHRLDEELDETFPASDPLSATIREPQETPKPA